MHSTVTPSHLTDLTDVVDTTPNRNVRELAGTNTKRKQTLLSLLDALHELSQDEEILGYGKVQQFCHFFDVNLSQVQATSQTLRVIGMSVSNLHEMCRLKKLSFNLSYCR